MEGLALLFVACRQTNEEASFPSEGPERRAPRASLAHPEAAKATIEDTTPPSESAKPPDTPKELSKVYLLPLGVPFPAADWEKIDEALRYFFRLEVERLPPVELPSESYYKPRNRYRAEKILAYLHERVPDDARVILGLTSVDISTTKEPHEDYGILGLATLSGRECVISKYRAGRGAISESHARERLSKVVVHEVGHTVGLPHCETSGCLMADARGAVSSTDHEFDLCSQCRRLAARFVVPRKGDLPWPEPARKER